MKLLIAPHRPNFLYTTIKNIIKYISKFALTATLTAQIFKPHQAFPNFKFASLFTSEGILLKERDYDFPEIGNLSDTKSDYGIPPAFCAIFFNDCPAVKFLCYSFHNVGIVISETYLDGEAITTPYSPNIKVAFAIEKTAKPKTKIIRDATNSKIIREATNSKCIGYIKGFFVH